MDLFLLLLTLHCWKHLEINRNPAVFCMDNYLLAVIYFDHCTKEKY